MDKARTKNRIEKEEDLDENQRDRVPDLADESEKEDVGEDALYSAPVRMGPAAAGGRPPFNNDPDNRDPIDLFQKAYGNRAALRLLHHGAAIQPKLKVGKPGDRFEQEADRVAEQVMRTPEQSSVQDKRKDKQDDDIAKKKSDIGDTIHPEITRTGDENTGESPLPDLENHIRAKSKMHGPVKTPLHLSRGVQPPHGGVPMPRHIRKRIEPHVGKSLKHVRIHNDANAHIAAQFIHSKAFTHKNHIYMGQGQSTDDISLMAHESVHVVQQGKNPSISNIQRTLIPESLQNSIYHGSFSSSQLRIRLELVENTLCQYDLPPSDFAMLEEERTRIQNELSRPERGGPESAPTSENRWTRPPAGISSARNLRILATPERHPLVVDTTIIFRYDYHGQASFRSADSPPPSYIRRVVDNWKVIDPDGQERDHGSNREIEIQLNKPGRWEIGITLEVADGAHKLWYQQDVVRPADIARAQMAQTSTEDFFHFRARLEQERQRLERFSEWAAVNTRREGPYITCSQPNPAGATADPDHIYHRYTMHTESSASRFRWYVRATDWENSARGMGYSRALVGNAYPIASDIEFERRAIDGENAWVRQGFLNTSSSMFTFIVNTPNLYTIVCEELTSEGRPTGRKARYIQVVTSQKEMRRLEAMRGHIRHVDKKIRKIKEGNETPVRAVYVNNETGNAMTLSMYTGPDTNEANNVKLLDLTPGVGRMEYDGDSVGDALDDFESGNSYPIGIISLEIPPNQAGAPPQIRRFKTTGSSDWSDWSSRTGWAALAFGALGAVATLAPVPGARVVAGVCFLAAAATGGASAGLSLYERLHRAEIDTEGVAIDVLGVASSIIGGASTFRALRFGTTAAIGTRTGRYLLWAEFNTDLASGVLLTDQGVGEISRIIESDASRGEKIGAIVLILSTLALNGGLLVLAARDLPTARGRIGERLETKISGDLDADIIHRINLLDDDALRALKGASSSDLEGIADLVRINRDAANKLIRSVGKDVLNHNIVSTKGRILINNQLDIHPSRLVEIEDNDLATILEKTSKTPVNEEAKNALKKISTSRSYRLRFQFQLDENKKWFSQTIKNAGLENNPCARRLLDNIDDAGRIRLQEARAGSLPTGVKIELPKRATIYAIGQNPANVREYVNHYEMFVSEYNRKRRILRIEIENRSEELMGGSDKIALAEANRKASIEILGDDIKGFRKRFNKKVLDGSGEGASYRGLMDDDVRKRSAELTAHLAGRTGPRRIDVFVREEGLGARIQEMSNLQFDNASAAVYHANKHEHDLPHAHRSPSYGDDPVSRYLRSANETIQKGTPHVKHNQDGSFNVTFTRNYGSREANAILRVDLDGRVKILTYHRLRR